MKLKSDSNEKFNEITKDMVLDGWEQRINSKGKVVVYAHFVPRTPVLAVEVREVNLKSSVEPQLRWFSAARQCRPPGFACKAGFHPVEMCPTRYLSAYNGFNAGSGSRILRKA